MSSTFFDWCLTSGRSIPKPSVHDEDTNQDAYASWVDEAGRGVIVACDGAGSLKRSREGARLVADTIVDEARLYLEDFPTSGDAAEDAQELMRVLTRVLTMALNTVRAAEDYKQMGCTVAVTIFCEQAFACATLGDAFVIVGDYQGSSPMYLSYVEEWDAPYITTFTSTANPRILLSCGTGATWALVASDGFKNSIVHPATEEVEEKLEESPFLGEPPLYLVLLSPTVDSFVAQLESQHYLDDDTTFVTAGCLNKPSDIYLKMVESVVEMKPVYDDGGFVDSLQVC